MKKRYKSLKYPNLSLSGLVKFERGVYETDKPWEQEIIERSSSYGIDIVVDNVDFSEEILANTQPDDKRPEGEQLAAQETFGVGMRAFVNLEVVAPDGSVTRYSVGEPPPTDGEDPVIKRAAQVLLERVGKENVSKFAAGFSSLKKRDMVAQLKALGLQVHEGMKRGDILILLSRVSKEAKRIASGGGVQ